jgi:cytochrome c biogenesis factor
MNIMNHLLYVNLENFNVLLLNSVNKYHPGLLYFSFIGILAVATLYSKNKNTSLVYNEFYLNNYYYFLKFYFLIITIALWMGSWWAFQEGSWGGWWNWDPSEVLGLLIFAVYIRTIHSTLTGYKIYMFYENIKLFFSLLALYYIFLQFNFNLISHNFGFKHDSFITIIDIYTLLFLINLLFISRIFFSKIYVKPVWKIFSKKFYELNFSYINFIILTAVTLVALKILLHDFILYNLNLNVLNTQVNISVFNLFYFIVLCIYIWNINTYKLFTFTLFYTFSSFYIIIYSVFLKNIYYYIHFLIITFLFINYNNLYENYSYFLYFNEKYIMLNNSNYTLGFFDFFSLKSNFFVLTQLNLDSSFHLTKINFFFKNLHSNLYSFGNISVDNLTLQLINFVTDYVKFYITIIDNNMYLLLVLYMILNALLIYSKYRNLIITY